MQDDKPYFTAALKMRSTMKMLLAVLLAAVPTVVLAQAKTTYVLENSTLSYHMVHPIHTVDGVSHAAKGKGVCELGQCEFLIAAPVKSFDSGDSNRDLHMLEVTRGAQFPLVVVKTRIPEQATKAPTVNADLTVQFAGQTVKYRNVPFTRTESGDEVHIHGVIPATCSDFKIDRPEFLTVPIKNEIPVTVDMTWKKM